MQISLNINRNETYMINEIAEHNDGVVVKRVFNDSFATSDVIDVVTSVLQVNEIFAFESSFTTVDLIFTLSNSSERAAVRKVEDLIYHPIVSLSEFARDYE